MTCFKKERQVFQPNVLPILRWAVVQPNMGQKPKETHDLEHNDIMFPMKTAMTGGYKGGSIPMPSGILHDQFLESWSPEKRHLVPTRTHANAVAEMNCC